MTKQIRGISLLVAILTLVILLTGCSGGHEKTLWGTWEFQHEYKYAGLTDCTIVFHEDGTITHTGISEQGGNYFVRDDESLRLIVGTGSFVVNDYDYDPVLGREKGSGCWCIINSSRVFIDGTMYKKISNEH